MSTAKLVSLDEYNGKRWRYFFGTVQPRPNGIACPKCGAELLDSSHAAIMLSNPPQVPVHCSNRECGYTGLRLA